MDNTTKPFEIRRDEHGWYLMNNYRVHGAKKIRCHSQAEAVARMNIHLIIAKLRAA